MAKAKKKRSTSLKRRLVALENQWAAGLLAPHEALALCVESGMPRHQQPLWIEAAIFCLSRKRRVLPERKDKRAKPLTSPEQTRFLASLALWVQNATGIDAANAAATAVAALNRDDKVRPRFPEGAAVVDRVVREMTKQRTDPKRRLHVTGEQVSRVIPYLPTPSRKKTT